MYILSTSRGALCHKCGKDAMRIWFRSRSSAAVALDLKAELNDEWAQARPFAEIPTVSSFSMVRNFLPGGKYHKTATNELMRSFKREYGDIFLWPAVWGKPHMVVTHNPEDFERVFRNEGTWPIRPGTETIGHYRGEYRADFFQGVEGLATTKGEQWGSFRTVVNPVMMQPRNVRLYLQRMSAVNMQFIEKIREVRDPKTFEAPDTFEDIINRWTFESVAVVALDRQLGLLQSDHHDANITRLFENLSEFFKLSTDLDLKPALWKYIATPKYKRLMRVFDNITYTILGFITEAIERLEQERLRGVTRPEHKQSVLEKLLKIDKKIATVMAMDMLMAGVDTTTSTFVGAMLCLAKNPPQQAKLREEVLRILPHKDSEFSDDALNNMPYLRACLKEAQRVYPLTTGNARVVANDVVLSGYRVPSGTQVNMVTTTLVDDDKHYPRASEFLPERWLRNDQTPTASMRASNPFTYLPFGFGARSCIGKRIVDMELMIGIARMVRNFQLEFNHPTENVFKSLIISMPNAPLRFKFTDIEY